MYAAAMNTSSVMAACRSRPRRARCRGRCTSCCPAAARTSCRRASRGRTGCRTRTARGPPVQRYASSAVHSACEVGFDSAKTIGRLLILRHLFEHFPRKRAADGRDADDAGRLQRRGSHRRSRRPAGGRGRRRLVRERASGATLHDQALRIEQPATLLALRPGRQAVRHPSRTRSRSAMPVAASPAPRNRTVWSASSGP